MSGSSVFSNSAIAISSVDGLRDFLKKLASVALRFIFFFDSAAGVGDLPNKVLRVASFAAAGADAACKAVALAATPSKKASADSGEATCAPEAGDSSAVAGAGVLGREKRLLRPESAAGAEASGLEGAANPLSAASIRSAAERWPRLLELPGEQVELLIWPAVFDRAKSSLLLRTGSGAGAGALMLAGAVALLASSAIGRQSPGRVPSLRPGQGFLMLHGVLLLQSRFSQLSNFGFVCVCGFRCRGCRLHLTTGVHRYP